jgi:hypothetical protein
MPEAGFHQSFKPLAGAMTQVESLKTQQRESFLKMNSIALRFGDAAAEDASTKIEEMFTIPQCVAYCSAFKHCVEKEKSKCRIK